MTTVSFQKPSLETIQRLPNPVLDDDFSLAVIEANEEVARLIAEQTQVLGASLSAFEYVDNGKNHAEDEPRGVLTLTFLATTGDQAQVDAYEALISDLDSLSVEVNGLQDKPTSTIKFTELYEPSMERSFDAGSQGINVMTYTWAFKGIKETVNTEQQS